MLLQISKRGESKRINEGENTTPFCARHPLFVGSLLVGVIPPLSESVKNISMLRSGFIALSVPMAHPSHAFSPCCQLGFSIFRTKDYFFLPLPFLAPLASLAAGVSAAGVDAAVVGSSLGFLPAGSTALFLAPLAESFFLVGILRGKEKDFRKN